MSGPADDAIGAPLPPSRGRLAFASALSTAPITESAVDEVMLELGTRPIGQADLVVLFVSMHHAGTFQTIADRFEEAFAPMALVGCTCEGVIGVQREVEGGPAIAAMVAAMPGARVAGISAQELGAAALTEDPNLLRALLPETVAGDLRGAMLLADPFSTPMVKLLPALSAAMPGVPIVGGMASGGRRAGQNRLVLDGKVIDQGAVGVAFAGDIDLQTTVSQGCRPIGRPFVITRAKRHVVQELGGRNALEAVQMMAGELTDADRELLTGGGVYVGRVINEYKPRFGRGDFLIRNVIGVDPESGYVAINDPQVRVGQTVQFHVRDAAAAGEDLAMLLGAQRVHGPAAGALLFSCNSRGRKLFDRANADADMVHAALGDVPLAGFFAAGEIGPVAETNFLHGHTASLLVFRERGGA